jgi:subfamily B ATP-binding cassette protein MsbA
VSVFFRLLEHARPYRHRLLAALGAMLVYGAASAGVAALIQPIFDEVLPNRENLVPIVVAILGIYVVKGVAGYLSSYWMTDVGQRVVRDLRNQLFGHILRQSVSFISQQTTGRLMSRITSDVAQVQRAVSETIGDLTRESLALLGFTALLFYYDPRLAIVCLTGAPLVVYPLVRLGQRVRKGAKGSQEALEHMSHVSAEAITGHRIVKAFGAEALETKKFEGASQNLYRTSMRVTRVLSVLPPLMEFIGGLAFVGALVYGSREIATGRLSPGEFTAFIAALFMMYAPARKLSRVNADLQQAMAAGERVFALLDTHNEVEERSDATDLPPFADRIEFRQVRFSYGGATSRATLDDVTFDVRAGTMLAIVGRSGAGKTTLVNLLPRFYDVTGGSICIDGHDIREATLSSLRLQIGIVTQETVLFDDTIAANIAYGRRDATMAQIEAAARAAHAHEFVAVLDRGYETMIGERGQRLSGGQRQRLAIARAILRDSPILILDEATSALDSESEMLVQDALSNLMRNRTSFIIAHRLSTVRRADAIIVIEQGTVVEFGTHEELLAAGGVYARLYDMQLQEEPADIEAEV